MDINDLISICVCIFFPVRDWNQYSFHLHYLLTVEIPNCTIPYFEGHRNRNQTYVVIIICALDTHPYLGNGNDSDTSDTINVRKLLF